MSELWGVKVLAGGIVVSTNQNHYQTFPAHLSPSQHCPSVTSSNSDKNLLSALLDLRRLKKSNSVAPISTLGLDFTRLANYPLSVLVRLMAAWLYKARDKGLLWLVIVAVLLGEPLW